MSKRYKTPLLSTLSLLLALHIATPSLASGNGAFVRIDRAAVPFDIEAAPFETHKYGGSLYGYLHQQTQNGAKYALLKFSDGTRSPNSVKATLLCKDNNGNVLAAVPMDNWMGASEKTMVHRYYYQVNCSGNVEIAWQKHTNYINVGKVKEEGLKAIIGSLGL